MIIRITLILVLIFSIFSGGYTYSKYDEWFKYPILRAHVNNQLKDPESTQYRNEQLKKSGWLCGELNSKNSSGGYTGFKRYIAGSADDAYLENHGYIGVDSGKDSNRLIERLSITTSLLKQHNALQAETGLNMRRSESAMDALVTKEIFDKKWHDICD